MHFPLSPQWNFHFLLPPRWKMGKGRMRKPKTEWLCDKMSQRPVWATVTPNDPCQSLILSILCTWVPTNLLSLKSPQKQYAPESPQGRTGEILRLRRDGGLRRVGFVEQEQ